MPSTLHLRPERPADMARAAALLRSGGTVAFPTETVYGLGANALDAAAVAAIFHAKQRPAWDPLIVHLADLAELDTVASVPPALGPRVQALAEAFWPGPLTLLLPRSPHVPDAVTAARPLVGVRVPAHPVARELLRLARLPIAAPSANTFGHTSPTTAAHVLADLDGRVDAVLDGGPTTVGVESTVLDPARMMVYRPGAVTLEQLASVSGTRPMIFVSEVSALPQKSLPSPGVGIRHYAPRARLVLVEPLAVGDLAHSLLAQASEVLAAGHSVGLMLPDGWAAPPGVHLFSWGQWYDPGELARRLFAGLRSLDDRGVDVIICPSPQNPGLGLAIRDRLEKAARSA